jgi:hypothetical protein
MLVQDGRIVNESTFTPFRCNYTMVLPILSPAIETVNQKNSHLFAEKI